MFGQPLHRFVFLTHQQNFYSTAFLRVADIVKHSQAAHSQAIVRPFHLLEALDAALGGSLRLIAQVRFNCLQHICTVVSAQSQNVFLCFWRKEDVIAQSGHIIAPLLDYSTTRLTDYCFAAQACVMRSMMMARMTMAIPASMPRPVSPRARPFTASRPRPAPPTMAEMITIASTIMII